MNNLTPIKRRKADAVDSDGDRIYAEGITELLEGESGEGKATIYKFETDKAYRISFEAEGYTGSQNFRRETLTESKWLARALLNMGPRPVDDFGVSLPGAVK